MLAVLAVFMVAGLPVLWCVNLRVVFILITLSV